jgi:hypothetical protein
MQCEKKPSEKLDYVFVHKESGKCVVFNGEDGKIVNHPKKLVINFDPDGKEPEVLFEAYDSEDSVEARLYHPEYCVVRIMARRP